MGPRVTLLEVLSRALAEGTASGTPVTLMLLDADDFAAFAARNGPLRADAHLDELAARLAACTRPSCTVVRTGGDGLAAVIAAPRIEAESLFVRFQADLRRRPPAAGPIGVSAGIAAAGSGERPAHLVARASGALRRAKAAGKGTAQAAA